MTGTLLRKKWQRLPEAAVRRLQAERLRQYLRTVVLPYSAHYQQLFREHDIEVDSLRTLEDLQRVPFTTKIDLLSTAGQPQRFNDFLLTPQQAMLARRPETLLRALVYG